MTLDNTNIAHCTLHIAHCTLHILLLLLLLHHCIHLVHFVYLDLWTSLPNSALRLTLSTSEPRYGLILATMNPTSSEIQAKRLKEGTTNKLKPHRCPSSEVTLLDSEPLNYNTESRDQIAFAVFGS